MKKRRRPGVGEALLEGMSEALAWARGEITLPVREYQGRERRDRRSGERAEAARRTVSIRLPEYLDCRLTALAKRRNTSRSRVLREALEGLIARSPKFTFGELAADLIGSVEGPGDLSTNPKYMEGFGQSNRRGKTRRHRHHRRP